MLKLPMRTLEKHAYIMNFVVAYKCSDCGMIFKIPVQKHITGVVSGPPEDVLNHFAKHTCVPQEDQPPSGESRR